MSRRLKVLKNFFSLTTAEVINRLAGLIYLPYIARIFGPEGFGKVNFAESIAGYFLLTANFGFDMIGIREVAKLKEEQTAFAHILLIEVLTSLLSFAALCVFAYFIPKPFEIKLLIVLYGLTVITFALTIEWYFIGMERMNVVAIVRLIKHSFYICLILLVVKSPEHLYRLPLSLVAANILGIAISFHLFFLKNRDRRFHVRTSELRRLCREALPLGVSNLLNASRDKIGPVLVGFMRSAGEVGFYSVGYKLVGVANIIPFMLYRAVFPDMTNFLKGKSPEEGRRYIKEIFKAVSLIAFPLSFLVFYNAAFLVRGIFGPHFEGGTIVLGAIIWTTAVLLFNRPYHYYLLAAGRQKKIFICASAGLIFNVLACFLFVKAWGAVGAAFALLLSELLLGIMYYFVSGIRVAPGREAMAGFFYFVPSLLLCILLKGRVHSLAASFLAVLLYAFILFRFCDIRSLLKPSLPKPGQYEGNTET